MIAKELHLKSYFSYIDETIIFNKDVYMIVGKRLDNDKNSSNGSGKSSIARGISYALHGDSTDESDIDQVKGDGIIHNDAKEAEVGFKFEAGGDDYHIIRKLKRGSTPTVYIGKNGEKPEKKGIRAAKELIQEIIKADFSIWKSTSYFQQRDLDAFSKLKPKQAKELVIKLLQLDIYNKYKKSAKDYVSNIESSILSIEKEIKAIEDLEKLQEEEKEEPKYTIDDLNEVKSKIRELEFHKKLQEFWDSSKDKNIEFIDNYISKVKDPITKINTEIMIISQRINKLASLTDSKKCPTCEQELNKEDIDKIIEILKKDRLSKEPRKSKLKKSLERANSIKDEIKTYKVNLYDEDAYYELISKFGEIDVILKKAKEEKKVADGLTDKKNKLQEELEEKKELADKYRKLQKAFGRNGIQAHIIENIIPEIEATSNSVLKMLDTNIRISLNSQKDLKKGGKAETLEIKCITRFGQRSYTNYSGGEKTLIDFSIRIALAVILARRSNCNIQTLILDEVFGELDSVNKQIVAKALQYIANSFGFKKVLIISHQEELQDICENKINVVFDGRCSKIVKGE